DLPFWQINRKMIGILRNLIEREFTDNVRLGAIAYDSVGLQFYWSIIEEFGTGRQDLANESDTVIGFHGLNLDVNIDFTGSKKQLTRRSADAADARKHGLIKCVENERCNETRKPAT